MFVEPLGAGRRLQGVLCDSVMPDRQMSYPRGLPPVHEENADLRPHPVSTGSEVQAFTHHLLTSRANINVSPQELY